MKRISLDEQIAKTPRSWIPYPIGQVDDHLVYIALYKDGDQPIYTSGNKFHSHEGDQLLIVLSGHVAFESRTGERIDASKGDAIFVGRGETHRASSKQGAHVLHVQLKTVAEAMKEEFDRGPERVAG
ncbi:MAG: cupin domain-containing protein [Planctomycetes bacterium]|nr:cupin domain-containing protein [Planctomycetota bacterium]